jgi:hypothetical protein
MPNHTDFRRTCVSVALFFNALVCVATSQPQSGTLDEILVTGERPGPAINQAVHELRHKRYAVELHRHVRTVLRSGGSYLVCDHFYGPGGMTNDQLYMTIEEQKAALETADFSVRQVLLKDGMVLHHGV